jgi:hypothetical protein
VLRADDYDDYEPDYDDRDDDYEPEPPDDYGYEEPDPEPPGTGRLWWRARRLWPRRDDPWRLPLRTRLRCRLQRPRQQPFDDEPPF